MLFFTASVGLDSIIGTCLWAAECTTTDGLIPPYQPAHQFAIADVGHQGHDRQLRPRPTELAVDLEEHELRPLHQQQRPHPEARQLPRELGADRAPGAGHHHRLAGQEPLQQLLVQDHRIAPKQILDLHVADAADLHRPRQDLVQPRDDLRLDRHALADLDDSTDVRSRGPRDGDDHVVDAELRRQPRQVPGGADDLHPLDHRPLLLRVVIDEAADLEIHVAAVRDLLRRQHPRLPGADQEHRLQAAVLRGTAPALLLVALVHDPADHPQAEHPTKGRQCIHEDDRQRHPPLLQRIRQQEPRRHQHHEGPKRCLEKRFDLGQPDVPPNKAVDPGQEQSGKLNQQHQRQLPEHPLHLTGVQHEIEAQQIGEHERRGQHRQVQRELRRPVEQARPRRPPCFSTSEVPRSLIGRRPHLQVRLPSSVTRVHSRRFPTFHQHHPSPVDHKRDDTERERTPQCTRSAAEGRADAGTGDRNHPDADPQHDLRVRPARDDEPLIQVRAVSLPDLLAPRKATQDRESAIGQEKPQTESRDEDQQWRPAPAGGQRHHREQETQRE